MNIIQAVEIRDGPCHNPISRLLYRRQQHRFKSSDERLILGLGASQLRGDRDKVSHLSFYQQISNYNNEKQAQHDIPFLMLFQGLERPRQLLV